MLSWKRGIDLALSGFVLAGAAAAAAQVVSTTGLPNEGVLRLELGAQDRLVWDRPAPAADSTQTISDRRDLTGRSQDKCLLQLGAVGSAPTLMSFSAGVPTNNQPGIAFDAIGVFGGGSGSTARGVDCSRVGANESLTLALTGQLAGKQVYRTELDVEVKQNARIRATARLGSDTSVWELRSGANIVGGVGSSEPGSEIFNCNAASDSGNDSGISDNCRWVIGGLWDSLELVTLAGEWSLEGGADFGTNALANSSSFFLTQASGILDCGDDTITAGDGLTSARAVGRRLDNADGSACILIPYLLTSSGNLVNFQKDLLDQTAAAFVFDITWLVEDAESIPSIPLTQHTFDGVTYFDLDLCVGTPTYDSSGNLTSLSGTLPDLDSSLPDIQYACIAGQQLEYVDTDTIRLRQTIYLRGDWISLRN